jgi:DNA ligase-1
MEYVRYLDKRVDLPILYKKKDENKFQFWEVWLELYNENNKMIKIKKEARLPEKYYSIIKSKYGFLDGAVQETAVHITKGKNIGKSNETNVLTQGILEMISKWKSKLNKDQYNMDGPNGKQIGLNLSNISEIRPMLLYEYEKKKTKIKFPACIQPKLDGVRMVSHYDPECKSFRFFSRNGKEYYNLNHIFKSLNQIKYLKENPDIYLDGEAFSEEISFNTIVGIVRKKLEVNTSSLTKQKIIKYYIFDMFDLKDLNMPFRERYKILNSFKLKDPLVLVKCTDVKSEKDIFKAHNKFIKTNEGSVIRNYNGPYALGKRSSEALKLKDFITEEFEVIGFTEGRGKDKGTIIYKLKTDEGKEFSARPEGTLKERKELYEKGEELIGKYLTVRFFEYTEDKVPRHPIGLAIREYE